MHVIDRSTLVLWATAGFAALGVVLSAHWVWFEPYEDAPWLSDVGRFLVSSLGYIPFGAALMFLAMGASIAVNGYPEEPNDGIRVRAFAAGAMSALATLIDIKDAPIIRALVVLATIVVLTILMFTRRPDDSWLVPLGRQKPKEQSTQ